MILIKRVLIVHAFLIGLKIFSRNATDQKFSAETDDLIKKDRMDLVNINLNNENIKFKPPSEYSLRYDLLIKLDSASALYKKGEYLNAEKAYLTILNKIENNKTQLTSADYENLKHIGISGLFYIEKRLGNVSQGLKYLQFFSKRMNSVQKKKQRLFFAVANIELGNYKKGIQTLNLRINDILLDTGDVLYSHFSKPEEIALTYNAKGDAFIKWFKDTGKKTYLDSSKINYEKAYKVLKRSPDYSQYSKSVLIDHLANIALLKKQYRYSLSLYNTCEKDSLLMKENFSSEAIWLGKAEIYTFLNKTDSAFYYINKLNNKVNHTYESKLKMYHLLSINYENTGDHKNAYKFAKLSMAEMEKKKNWDNSGHTFLRMNEQQEITFLSEEMLNNNKRYSFLSIALIILIFSIIILYIIYRNNKRKKIIFSEFPQKIDEINNSSMYPLIAQKEEVPLIIEDELVRRILKKITLMELDKKFLSNDFKLSHIAKQVNTNTTYLSQIINQHKGMTFSEYVNDLRISYILKELSENPRLRKYTIKTISEEIGYKSASTFINAFKNRAKMTPSYYIQLLEKKINL
jgi:AraC-like DNA-binding protein